MGHFDFTTALSNLILWTIIAVALYLGNKYLYAEFKDTRGREDAAETWPSVTGEITSAGVKTHTHINDGRKETVAFPRLSYTYEVEGKKHHSSKIVAGGEIGGVNVESTLERYQHGSQVTVYYNPKDPKDAVLRSGDHSISNALIALMVIFNLFMIVFCIVATLER